MRRVGCRRRSRRKALAMQALGSRRRVTTAPRHCNRDVPVARVCELSASPLRHRFRISPAAIPWWPQREATCEERTRRGGNGWPRRSSSSSSRMGSRSRSRSRAGPHVSVRTRTFHQGMRLVFFFEAVLCSCAQPMRAYAGYECPDPWIYEASSNPNDLYAVMGVDSRESATRILLRVCFQVFHLITLEYPSLC